MAGTTDKPLTTIVPDKLCDLGRLGQKTNAGFYTYPEGSRQGQPDPAVAKLIEDTSAELGFSRREISEDEILKRCLYPLINIGAQLLDDGIALRASDIDVVYIYGYGFPKYRGGPMYYADQVGLDNVYRDILAFHQEYGGSVATGTAVEAVGGGRRVVRRVGLGEAERWRWLTTTPTGSLGLRKIKHMSAGAPSCRP